MTRRLFAAATLIFTASAGAAWSQQHPGGQAGASTTTATPISFTEAQATAGATTYARVCAACHGAKLDGAPALAGSGFRNKWGGKAADQLFSTIRSMPPGASDTLNPAQSAEVFAYILKFNGVPAGSEALPADPALLAKRVIPASTAPARTGNVPPPAASPRLAALAPVNTAMLDAPPAADWLSWRRTADGAGYSPLDQINPGNVGTLRVAWSWSLPQGGNMMTPIVHDGVLYALSFGDIVEALDAATGELLWRYQRPLAVSAQGKKGVAIAGNLVILPASDMHIVALDAKTGAVVWDHAIDGADAKQQIKSAPLIAGDKVVIGVNGFQDVKGGNFIAAFDLATGAERWRFRTVAVPPDPNADSWNGEAPALRSGGSVWVGGSYDPASATVYFGAAPTYDIVPLRPRPGEKRDNRGLYGNTTLALDAATGKLKWFYQHQANDQLDHDWTFERLLVPLNGRQTVVTAGKDAIFDALDARTGRYLFSLDMGLQNTVAGIDPKTGQKMINPAAVTAGDKIAFRYTPAGICPDLLGARNLMAGAYDPARKLLFMPLTDTCIHPFPNGKRWQKNPDPATDGTYGVLNAIDLNGRKVVWSTRTRGAFVSAALATGGGLIFAGTVDRRFKAFDAKSGAELWDTGVDNSPASFPVTYAVDGRQYVAVATNEGFVHTQAMAQVMKLRMPPNGGATLWVFALPTKTR